MVTTAGEHLTGLVGVVVNGLLAAQDDLRLFFLADGLEQLGDGQGLQFGVALDQDGAVGADGHRRAQGFLATGHPGRNGHHFIGNTGFFQANGFFNGNFVERIDRHLGVGYINARAIRLDPYLDVVIHHPLDWNKYLQCCSPLSGKSMNTPFDIPCAQPYPDHTGEYGKHTVGYGYCQ